MGDMTPDDLEALRKDAERYRFVREQMFARLHSDRVPPLFVVVEFPADIETCDLMKPGEAWDHYVDAAMHNGREGDGT